MRRHSTAGTYGCLASTAKHGLEQQVWANPEIQCVARNCESYTAILLLCRECGYSWKAGVLASFSASVPTQVVTNYKMCRLASTLVWLTGHCQFYSKCVDTGRILAYTLTVWSWQVFEHEHALGPSCARLAARSINIYTAHALTRHSRNTLCWDSIPMLVLEG